MRVRNLRVLRRPQEAIRQRLGVKLVHLVDKRGDFISFLDGSLLEDVPQLFNPRAHYRQQVVMNVLCQVKYRRLTSADVGKKGGLIERTQVQPVAFIYLQPMAPVEFIENCENILALIN